MEKIFISSLVLLLVGWAGIDVLSAMNTSVAGADPFFKILIKLNLFGVAYLSALGVVLLPLLMKGPSGIKELADRSLNEIALGLAKVGGVVVLPIAVIFAYFA